MDEEEGPRLTDHERKLKEAERVRQDALRDILGDHGGRRLLAEWLRQLGLHEYSPPERRDEFEGRRGAALFIWGEVQKADPKLAALLAREEIENGRF